jgi:hypothetical protein
MWMGGDIPPPFLTSALDKGEWSASPSGSFIPGWSGCCEEKYLLILLGIEL